MSWNNVETHGWPPSVTGTSTIVDNKNQANTRGETVPMKQESAEQSAGDCTTRKIILFALVAAALTSLADGTSWAETRAGTTRVVAYYHSRVRSTYTYTQVDYSQMTDLAHAFVWPNADGTLNVPTEFVYPELVQAAHAHGVRIVVSVGAGANRVILP